jgi:hypothetical protein
MSISIMTAAASILVWDFEVSTRAVPAHSPHNGERAGGKACVKAALCAPRSGRRALTQAAPRPCSWWWGTVTLQISGDNQGT